MSIRRASLLPTADELAVVRNLVVSTESQISSIDALLVTFTNKLKSTNEKQQELEAELPTRRRLLLEWTQRKDRLSDTPILRPRPFLAHALGVYRTAMPPDDGWARRPVAQEKKDIDTTHLSMDTCEATIADLRSRVAVLEEGIAHCEAAASHIKLMMALQSPHKDQLNDLLCQYESRLHPRPLLRLPDKCLRDIFLHVARLCWGRCKGILVGEESHSVVSSHECHPALTISVVCYRWREVATHTPELWSTITIGDGRTSQLVDRIVYYIHLAKDRALSIIVTQRPRFTRGDIQLLRVFESNKVTLDTLGLTLHSDVPENEEIMKVLPSPRALILQDHARFSSVSIPQERLSRMEELTVLGCTATITNTAPMLRRFELNLEHTHHLTPSPQYLPSLLKCLPQLECLSIRCWTKTDSLSSRPPSLLVSPGACQSVTWLQIPLMALCSAVENLQTSFVLPSLVKLSLLNFLRDGSNLQSWRNFCEVNGGKINHLYLNGGVSMHDYPSPLCGQPPRLLAWYLQCLPGIKFVSLSVSLVDCFLLALKEDVGVGPGVCKNSSIVPNLEICEIYSLVKTSALRAKIETRLGRWSESRNIRRGEAPRQCSPVTVLWP